ncbi:hypothetical protein [Rhizobium binxianense]
MNRRRFRQLCLAVAFAALACPAFGQDKPTNQAIDELLGDHTKYKTVIDALQKAVSAHDVAGVAALVSYPIGVKVRGKETVVKSAKAFAEHYDGIMTSAITKAVVNQKYDDLFVNDQGVMFGDGQVWVNGICHDNACKNFDVKVITIQDGPK